MVNLSFSSNNRERTIENVFKAKKVLQGLKEKYFFSVNIGTRQSGRPKSKTVINVGYNKNHIKKAVKKAIDDEKFNNIKTAQSLYGNGNSSKKIIKILEKINLNKISIQKKLAY